MTPIPLWRPAAHQPLLTKITALNMFRLSAGALLCFLPMEVFGAAPREIRYETLGVREWAILNRIFPGGWTWRSLWCREERHPVQEQGKAWKSAFLRKRSWREAAFSVSGSVGGSLVRPSPPLRSLLPEPPCRLSLSCFSGSPSGLL